MAQFAGVAQRDFPIVIHAVGAGAVFGVMAGIRGGFGQCDVGLGWGAAVDGSVGSLGVIPGLKQHQHRLEFGDGFGCWGGAVSQRFRVWWKRSILPWVWGCPGAPLRC